MTDRAPHRRLLVLINVGFAFVLLRDLIPQFFGPGTSVPQACVSTPIHTSPYPDEGGSGLPGVGFFQRSGAIYCDFDPSGAQTYLGTLVILPILAFHVASYLLVRRLVRGLGHPASATPVGILSWFLLAGGYAAGTASALAERALEHTLVRAPQSWESAFFTLDTAPAVAGLTLLAVSLALRSKDRSPAP